MTKEKLKQRLIESVEAKKDELIELCSDLIKIDSQNPPGHSDKITEFIVNYLNGFDLEAETYESNPRMYNIISKYGSDQGKKLIYCGHSDVVPAGNLEKWDFDPMSGEVKDGFLLGRGASDMKAGLGGIIFVTALLKRLNIELPGELILAVVPDEETGGEYGVPWLLERQLIAGDGALIAEPSSKFNPTIGQKGSYWFTLEVFGKPGHGSLSPIIGHNAITDVIRAIDVIKSLHEWEIEIPEDAQELVEVSKKYMREVEKERERFQPILDHISYNIGMIKGGTKANIVPESCIIEVDCRLPFGVTEEEVTDYLFKEWDNLGISYKMTRFGIRSEANYTLPEDPICQAIVNNLADITQHEAYGVMQWASSDARHFRDHNIPVLQYGPAFLSTIHGYNERVEVDKIVLAAKVYAAAVIDFLFD